MRTVLSAIALIFLAFPSAANPTDNEMNLGWASHRDLSSARYAELFQHYSNLGYRLIDIDVYTIGGNLRYAMVWRENTDGRGWAALRDLTSQQYQQRWDEFRDAGFRLLDVEAYMTGAGLRFAGIWVENVEGIGYSSRRGMTSQEFSAYFDEQVAAGRRLIDIEAYTTNDGLRFAAIWYNNVGNVAWQQRRNMTREEYLDRVDELSPQYWVIDYEAYETPSGLRYAAIWEARPANRAYQLRTNRTELDFANLWRQYRDEGYRLVDFERNDTPQGPRYSGIWVENSDRYRYPLKGQIADAIEQYRVANGIPGISVSIVVNGATVFRRGFGFADAEEGKVAHGRSVFNSASVSKVFGGALAAKLEDEGRLSDGTPVTGLDLSNPTAQYLTSIPAHHTHQVDHLFAHLGCMAHYSTTPGIPNQTAHYSNAAQAAASIWNTGLLDNCTIGQTRSYSTHGFTLVGAVLEAATNRDINRLIIEEIAEPYNLASLRPQFASAQLPANYERAVPYNDAGNPVSYQNSSWKVLGGGLELDAVDLSRFGWLVLNGSIVAPIQRDERMWSPVREGCGNSNAGACRNGLAWELRTIGGRRVAEHNGSWSGARSHLRVYRDDGLVIAVMSNRRGHTPADLVTTLGNIILPFISSLPEEPASPPVPALLQNYPNPFRDATAIEYELPQPSFVSLTVSDLHGRRVATLVHGQQQAGEHRVEFDASGLPSGFYIYTLQSSSSVQSRKMALVR